jgi:hypothetical protein
MNPLNHHRRRGVGLAELLIAMSIAAALLTAVAAATHAGFRSYEANVVASDTTQRARLVADRALTLLRSTDDYLDASGYDHDPGPLSSAPRADFEKGLIVSDTGFIVFEPIESIDPDDGSTVWTYRQVEWRFDSDAGQLLQTIDGGTERVLLRDVRGFRVTFQPMRSRNNQRLGVATFDQLRRASMVLTVGLPAPSGNVAAGSSDTFTLSGSASPRRNVGV